MYLIVYVFKIYLKIYLLLQQCDMDVHKYIGRYKGVVKESVLD